MSEEPSMGAPESAAADGEPIPAPEVEAPEPAASEASEASGAEASQVPAGASDVATAPGLRWLTRLRGTSLRVRITVAAVVAAVLAVIAAVVSVAVPSSSPQEYTGLPAPCSLVSGPTLARYLPDAESGALTAPASKAKQAGGCNWSSYTLRGDRYLLLHVALFGSPAEASRSASGPERGPLLLCLSSCTAATIKQDTVTQRSVTGVGDRATAWIVGFKADSAAAGLPWTVPQIGLVVRSANAVIDLTYAVYAGLNSPPKPATAALLADTMAMARSVLASLAGGPAVSAAAPPAYRSTRGLLYVTPRHPCGLVKTSTLVRYAPGVTPTGLPKPPGSYSWSPRQEGCFWSGYAYVVGLFVTVYSASGTAQSEILGDVQAAHEGGAGTFHGSQLVPGLGDQATAVFVAYGPDYAPQVNLYVSEANVAIETSVVLTSSGPSPSRAAMLAADIAMARDALADLPTS